MNSLRYTNAVLTLIAAALAVIAVENIVRPSAAQSPRVQPVVICDKFGVNCLDVDTVPNLLAGSISFIRVRPVPVP
jgi:hypothetical protein